MPPKLAVIAPLRKALEAIAAKGGKPAEVAQRNLKIVERVEELSKIFWKLPD